MSWRIVGGVEAPAHSHPFVLSLLELGSHICGASLIAPLWALTAAHCIHPSSPPFHYAIDFHRHDLSLSASRDHPCAERVGVASVHCNALFSKKLLGHDICLIKLSQPPRCAANVSLPRLDDGTSSGAGTEATVVGWGAISDAVDAHSAHRLRTVDLHIISNEECTTYMQLDDPFIQISPGMLCALTPGKDACAGDSGGPLFHAATAESVHPVQAPSCLDSKLLVAC